MTVEKKLFGVLGDGTEVPLFFVDNGAVRFTVTAMGASLVSLNVPSASGRIDDIVWGYNTVDRYCPSAYFFGTAVGPFANRIAGASFALNGKTYHLEQNDGPNNLHSGLQFGFTHKVWQGEPFCNADSAGVTFTVTRPDGEGGFPGNLIAKVTYILDAANRLTLHFYAETDADTPVNMTNHSYFNLGGQWNPSVLNHELTLHCSKYLPVDTNLIPTGERASVDSTPFDFRSTKTIGRDIRKLENGYDHCFVIDGDPLNAKKPVVFAVLKDPVSGRSMECSTTLPGVQLYSSNFVKHEIGKGVYDKWGAVCLETQHFPDAPNQPSFPSCIAKPGSPFDHTTVFALNW